MTEGLTDAGLSDWGSSYHNVFTDIGSFTDLAVGVDFGSLPVTLAGTFGSGRIVLTGQDPDFHYVYGPSKQQVEFLHNAVNWVSQAATPTVSISTDTFKYSPGEMMTISIDITNPTEDSVTFHWYWVFLSLRFGFL